MITYVIGLSSLIQMLDNYNYVCDPASSPSFSMPLQVVQDEQHPHNQDVHCDIVTRKTKYAGFPTLNAVALFYFRLHVDSYAICITKY